MATGTVLTLRGSTTASAPLFDTLTLDSIEMNRPFHHDASFVAILTRCVQPIQPAGYVQPVNPSTGHSPNLTREFVVEVLYPEGMSPNTAGTLESFRLQALAEINSAFNVTLT